MSKLTLMLPVLCLLGACASTGKFADNAPPAMIDEGAWKSRGFVNAHPDLKHRLKGQVHFEEGRFDEARAEFVEAAHYGDKLSQAMIAEMYWSGQGGPVDRAKAYAWMDLAAERGFVTFVSKRERYWQAMSTAEQEKAKGIGSELYAAYGDAAGVKRLSFKLKSGIAGSVVRRMGYTSRGKVIVPGAHTRVQLYGGGYRPLQAVGGAVVDFDDFYNPDFWRVDQYVNWHAKQLELARRGFVEVGEPKAVDGPEDGQL